MLYCAQVSQMIYCPCCTQMFLVWRFPVRTHPHKNAVAPQHSVLKDIQERFYEDYVSDERKSELKVQTN